MVGRTTEAAPHRARGDGCRTDEAGAALSSTDYSSQDGPAADGSTNLTATTPPTLDDTRPETGEPTATVTEPGARADTKP
jgi:hypothetical protein